jgi:PPOX class probable F420-dependent enzyme
VTAFSTDGLESLLEGPSPAVLTTHRMDGSALVSPVWFRYADDVFEVVVAEGDVKLRHLARDPRAVLVVFEAAPPFRGVEVRGDATVVPGDVSQARVEIASRYLGRADGERFAAQRASRPGVLVRLRSSVVRSWDLTAILPD